MKKLALAVTIVLVLVACKSETNDGKELPNEETTEQYGTQTNNELKKMNNVNDGTKRYRGEFIYVADGAVLKGSNFIYGVAINDMAEELRDRVAPVKKDTYDMVPVIVKGILAKKENSDEGWDEILTITEIVDVSKTPAEADIKIEDKKN